MVEPNRMDDGRKQEAATSELVVKQHGLTLYHYFARTDPDVPFS